jgi:hypothetical protein
MPGRNWPGRNLSPSARAASFALAAALAVFFWQFLTVHYNYRGNWTGLFCIRPGMPVPGFLESERLFVFKKGGGYDGMAYHLIAHDPFLRKGSAQAISDAPFRYQRILVPLLAWLLAFGQDQWIHAAYFTVILAFVFLGVYWVSLFAPRMGLAPAWGLAFLLTPAAITSIDRMTVDIALAALAAAFLLYVKEKPDWRILVILVLAALTRETGAVLAAGYAIYLFTRKNLAGGLLVTSTAAPAALWFLYLSGRQKSALPHFVNLIPLHTYFFRLIHPRHYRLPPIEQLAVRAFDVIAFLGIALALCYAARLLIQRAWDPRSAALYALALSAIFLGTGGVWFDAYAYGRVLTPFLLLTALLSTGIRPLVAFLPMLLLDTRIALNFGSQIMGIARGLIHVRH